MSINELVDIIAKIARVHINKDYIEGPQGARGRNCDISRLVALTGWEPPISLETGLETLYDWIESKVYG